VKVIVNADDLGRSQDVNAAVFDLMARGCVSSATILANGPAVEEAVRQAYRFPRCSFGVHLNATEFKPLTSDPALAPLLDADGCLVRVIEGIRRPPALLAAVYREWCAQVSFLLMKGVPVAHLDSHHHVHTLPELFPVIKAVQRRFGIRKVRLTKNVYRQDEYPGAAKRAAKATFNWMLRNVYATSTTAAFTEFGTFHDLFQSGACRRLDTVEVMVHPGSGTEADARESDLLARPWRQLTTPAAALISYHDL
jgi:predicted glycoside hydrolase/deacetylase ChbG (UPF0249 family)